MKTYCASTASDGSGSYGTRIRHDPMLCPLSLARCGLADYEVVPSTESDRVTNPNGAISDNGSKCEESESGVESRS